MGRLVAFFTICLLFASVASDSVIPNPLIVQGKVYCDTCRCGFETPATTYLGVAHVKIECKDRVTEAITYTIEAVTNSKGEYNILVTSDRGTDACYVIVIKSSDPICAKPIPGRDRSSVPLTRDNGIISDFRFVNSIGFLRDEPLSTCKQILQKYNLTEDCKLS